MSANGLGATARTLPVVCLLILAACGGGGGGGGGEDPPAEPFSGAYGFTSLQAIIEPVGHAESRWGRMEPNGVTQLALDFGRNLDGSVATLSRDHRYQVLPDRRLTFSDPDVIYARGRVSESNRVAALSWTEEGDWPGIILAVQRGSGMGDGDLVGTYHACSILCRLGTVFHTGSVGTGVFDGAGGGTGAVRVNTLGSTGPEHELDPITYRVQSTGATIYEPPAAPDLLGQLLLDGEILTLAGSSESGNDQFLSCYVRAGLGMVAADLEGTYGLVGLYYDFRVGAEDWRSVNGTFTADGAGSYTATFRRNAASVISGTVTETGTYGVSPDGHLTVTSAGGHVYEGGLASDGRFGMYGGGTSTGAFPALFLLLR